MKPTPSERPLLLIVSSGHRAYREYLFQQISPDYDIWLAQPKTPDWETGYIQGFTFTDYQIAKQTAEHLKQSTGNRTIVGILCWDEWRTAFTAALACELDCHYTNEAAILRCRDKLATRTTLADQCITQPAFREVRSVEDAKEASLEIGLPMVIKPRGLGASIGVTCVYQREDIATAFQHAVFSKENGALHFGDSAIAEEYIGGEEISVDCAVFQGKVTPLFIGRKTLDFHPYCEETGHGVNASDPLLNDSDFHITLQRLHESLNFTDGITHSEWKLIDKDPVLIEINARIGGGVIPLAGYEATGISIGKIAADIAVGRAPQINQTQSLATYVHFVYPPENGRVCCIHTNPQHFTDALRRLEILVKSGEFLALPPEGHVTSRVAYFITAAQTPEQAKALALNAENCITVEMNHADTTNTELDTVLHLR